MLVWGVFGWLFAGTIIIHFWGAFIPSNHFTETNPASVGMSMGIMSLVIGMIYLVECILIIVIHNLDAKSGRNRVGQVVVYGPDQVEYRVVPSQKT